MLNSDHSEFKFFKFNFRPIINLFKIKLGIDLELHYFKFKEFIDLLDKSQQC